MSVCSLHQNVYCDRKRQRGSRSEPDGAGRGPDGAVRGAAFSSQPAGPFVARTLRLRILRPALPPDARGHDREANPAIAGTLEALTRAARIAPSRVQHSDPCRVCILAVTPTQRSRPCPRGLLSLCPRQAARGAGRWKRPPWAQKAGRACSVRERGGGGLRGGGFPSGAGDALPHLQGERGTPSAGHLPATTAGRPQPANPPPAAPPRCAGPPVSTGQPRG